MTTVFIPREIQAGETRVAATPETVKRLVKLGLQVSVEAGAGLGSHILDQEYEQAGAKVGGDLAGLWGAAVGHDPRGSMLAALLYDRVNANQPVLHAIKCSFVTIKSAAGCLTRSQLHVSFCRGSSSFAPP